MTATTTVPTLRFRLPGKWWQIPLADPAEARTSVRRLVDRAVGPRDDHVREREALRSQLNEAVEHAIAGHGLSMQVALEVVEDLPIPVSFTVFQPTLRISPSIGTDGAAVIAILQRGLQERENFNAERVSRFSVQRSEVLRTHRATAASLSSDAGADAEELTGLAADYWLSVPGEKRVVLVSFSTALAGLDEIMLGFFDSIIGASYWEGLADERATETAAQH